MRAMREDYQSIHIEIGNGDWRRGKRKLLVPTDDHKHHEERYHLAHCTDGLRITRIMAPEKPVASADANGSDEADLAKVYGHRGLHVACEDVADIIRPSKS